MRFHPSSGFVSMVAAFVAGAAIVFAGATVFYLVTSNNSRNQSRRESCEAFHTLYVNNRARVVENDIALRRGAYKDIFPSFSTPKALKVLHANSVKSFFTDNGNQNLPNYCKQHDWPEKVPRGFILKQ